MPFATNLLTVIVPTHNPAKIRVARDLAGRGVKVIAAGDSVPITKYATQLVTNLAKQPGYPTDFVAAYTANIASKEDNVGAVVAKVGLGEGDAAIVYQTDAKTSAKVSGDPCSGRCQRGCDLRRCRGQGVTESGRGGDVPAVACGPEGQSILTAAGFMPAD